MDEQTFLKLAARKLSGEANEQDLNELQDFLKVDSAYKRKFDLLKSFWEHKDNFQTDTHNALQKVLHQIQEESNEPEEVSSSVSLKRKRRSIRFLFKVSAAAAFILICIIAAWHTFKKPDKIPIASVKEKSTQWQVRETPKANKSTIILSDGTKVIMNADSKLEYPKTFAGNSREVYLTGEAYFDVEHDESMPFIIHTAQMNIKVLGTEFNVKSYPEDSISETTLIRGLIEVTLKDRPSDKIILRPKEKLVVSNESSANSISSISKPSTDIDTRLVISNLHYVSPTDSAIVETSWLNDKLVFQNKSFDNLAGDLERRYGVNIEFKNEQIKNFRFTGIFENENIDQVLSALGMTEKFNYKKNGNNIIIF